MGNIDENKVTMANATPEKLCGIFNEVKAAWNPAHDRFKRSGSHNNWRSFSGGERWQLYATNLGFLYSIGTTPEFTIAKLYPRCTMATFL